jgi:predicted phage terminase large subunit-like protein
MLAGYDRYNAVELARSTPPPDFREMVERTVNFQLHEWQKIVCETFNQLKTRKGMRLVMHGPPQFGKTILTGQRLPAWLLGVFPSHRVGLACYNIDRAAAHGDVTRQIMLSREYRELFPNPDCHISPIGSSREFFTPARMRERDAQASFVALGLHTGFTGRGLDTLIIDDPYASVAEAYSETTNEAVWRWWTATAKVRLDPEANVICLFHRYHEDDLTGRLLAEGGWEYYRFPAIADEEGNDPTGREPGVLLSTMRTEAFLEDIRERDPQTFLGQFQGIPRPPEGAFFKREWFVTEPTPPRFKRVIRFWDLATKADQRADFTSGVLMGVSGQKVWILDVVRFRAEWPDACEQIAQIALGDYSRFKPLGTNYAVAVEKVAWQRPMIQDLFRQGIFDRVPLTAIPAKGDKKERASGWAARARHDGLRLVQSVIWNQDFINECLSFDGTGITHDDQVDAASGAYELLWDDVSSETREETREERVARYRNEITPRAGWEPDAGGDGEDGGIWID